MKRLVTLCQQMKRVTLSLSKRFRCIDFERFNLTKLVSPIALNKVWVASICLLLVLFSCEEEEIGSDTFVVEGFVYAGSPITDINIKSTVPFDAVSTPGQPIPTAQATINMDGQSVPLTFNPETQRYEGPQDFIVEPGLDLRLDLQVGELSATGQTLVPSYPQGLNTSISKIIIPEIELSRDLREVLTALFEDARLDIRWENAAEDFHFLVIEPADTANTEPLFNEDIPSNVGTFFDNFRLVSEPSRDSTYTVVGLSLQNYGSYRAILYRINQEYADLYADQLQDSRNLNEPPSNIENGLGIFTGISSDTILFEISKF
ncbi:MAG: DUF4249 family protein [Cyclobacteriaceae bacterium]